MPRSKKTRHYSIWRNQVEMGIEDGFAHILAASIAECKKQDVILSVIPFTAPFQWAMLSNRGPQLWLARESRMTIKLLRPLLVPIRIRNADLLEFEIQP